ncbi:MAG TPA: hypothetical protein VF806_03090, partial [Anaerolineaceae bacterium]
MSNQTSKGPTEFQNRMSGRGPAARLNHIERAHDPRRALVRLLPYLRPFRLLMALVLVFVLIYTLLGLLGPYLMGVAIDRFISTK